MHFLKRDVILCILKLSITYLPLGSPLKCICQYIYSTYFVISACSDGQHYLCSARAWGSWQNGPLPAYYWLGIYYLLWEWTEIPPGTITVFCLFWLFVCVCTRNTIFCFWINQFLLDFQMFYKVVKLASILKII